MQLRDGSEVKDPRLDRLYEVDMRSLNYPMRAALPRRATRWPRSYTHKIPDNIVLDQGTEGRCVEFGICHELMAKPVPIPFGNIQSILLNKLIYWPAQEEDEWEGGSYPGASPVYEGTSVLSGLKVASRLGYFDEYRWCFTVQDIAMTLGYEGPIVIGVNMHEGMMETNAAGFIFPTGAVVGGHCMCVNRVKIIHKKGTLWWQRSWETVDLDLSYVEGLNSWGPSWGDNGRWRMSLRNLQVLIPGGDFGVPIRRKKGAVV